MLLLQSKHQHGANRSTGLFFLQNILSYQSTKLLCIYFGMNTVLLRRLWAAEIFGKMKAMEHHCFTAFFTDMALVTCFVWQAIRLV